MTTLTLISYGNAQILREVFNAIALMLGEQSYQTLMRIAILCSGVVVCLHYALQKNIFLQIKWLATCFFITSILLSPKAELLLLDRVHADQSYTVSGVPLGLAITASVSSQVGDALTQMVEKHFSLPDDLQYQKNGMLMSSRMLSSSLQDSLLNPKLKTALSAFMRQCVLYDVRFGRYSWRDLHQQSDLAKFFASHTAKHRYFDNGETLQTCRTGFQGIRSQLSHAVNADVFKHAHKFFPFVNNALAKSLYLSTLSQSYHYLLSISQSAPRILKQNMLVNALQSGMASFSGQVDAVGAMQAYAFSRAQLSRRLAQSTLAKMAAHWLPVLKNIFEGMIYGAFILIIPLLFFDFGFSVLKNYVCSLFWLQAWAPLYAIINLFVSFYAQAKFQGLSVHTSGLSLSAWTSVQVLNSDIIGLAGYLSMSVPFLASGLVKGMSSTMTQLAHSFGAVAQGASMQSAIESSGGNLQLGNTQWQEQRGFNTELNQHQSAFSSAQHGMQIQQTDGAVYSYSDEGGVNLDLRATQSKLPLQFSFQEAVQQRLSTQLGEQQNAVASEQMTLKGAQTQLTEHLYNLSGTEQLANIKSNTEDVSQLQHYQSAMQRIHHHVDSQTQAHQRSHDWRAEVGGMASGMFGSPGLLGGSAGVEVSGQYQYDNVYQQNQSEEQGVQHQLQKDVAFVTDMLNRRQVQYEGRVEQSETEAFRTTHSDMQQAEHTLQADQQNVLRTEHTLSQFKTDGFSISQDLNSRFVSWLSAHPKTGADEAMGMSAAEHMLTSEPAQVRRYADAFVREQAQDYLESVKIEHVDSSLDSNPTPKSNRLSSLPEADVPQSESIHDSSSENIQAASYQFSHMRHAPFDSQALDFTKQSLRADGAQRIHEGFVQTEQGEPDLQNLAHEDSGK